ncbi:unnamed protein product [Larinioides sclopetarius]|uniref:Uncharacterized protein n=1 Tax=Larinioides sclopetarius TaxID=280406 RepID=A0AAV2A5Z0_9ARAC
MNNLDIRNRIKHLGMEPETKNSVQGPHKIVVLFGIIFCTVVAVLLLVLYYPSDSVEKEFDKAFEKVTPIGNLKDWDLTNTGHEDTSRTRVEDMARALEDFGAAFLALVAVGCVAVGLTCLFCACCILK